MKVELQNLTKIFPSRNKKSGGQVVAVNDFTFTIPDGKLIGLLGPSGCGKSTTLYMICGLQKPTGGKIFFGDDDVTELSPENRGVGLVFQNYALYPHMTVGQNIMFPLQNLKGADKLTKEEMLDRTYEAAKLVQIEELLDRKPSELSGGQQQRVAIARALVKMPRVLLLDEPLSNLDARLRLQTREEIRRIQRETKITTVFVTHDQEEAMSISDMIVVMKLGVVQQIGAPQDVYDDPHNMFVARFLGTPPINIFEGEVKKEKLYINGEAVLDVKGIDDREVYVGIRPEGFVPAKNGKMKCKLSGIEVMGRDVSIISTNPAARSATIRSIVDADCRVDPASDTVAFNLKPHKVFVFSKNEELDGIKTLSGTVTSADENGATITVGNLTEKPVFIHDLTGDGAENVAVGDTVVVSGKLANRGGKVEFSGTAKLISLEKAKTKKQKKAEPAEDGLRIDPVVEESEKTLYDALALGEATEQRLYFEVK